MGPRTDARNASTKYMKKNIDSIKYKNDYLQISSGDMIQFRDSKNSAKILCFSSAWLGTVQPQLVLITIFYFLQNS